MPQLLTVLALSCPNLRRLSIKLPTECPDEYKEYHHDGMIDDGGDWDTWAGCLPLLRQLEVLILDGMNFRPWTVCDQSYDRHHDDIDHHDHLLENLEQVLQLDQRRYRLCGGGFFQGAEA